MSPKFPSLLRTLLLGFLLFCAFVLGGIVLDSALASWSPPSIAPPGNNAEPPLNTSSTGQNKASWLTFDGGGTRGDTFLATTGGNVGIGTMGPSRLLEVNRALGAGDQNIAGFYNATGNGVIEVGTIPASSRSLALTYDDTNNYGAIRISGEAAGTGINIADGGNVGIGTTSPQGLLHTYTPLARNFLFVDSDRNGDNPAAFQLWGPFADGQKGKFQMVVRGNHPTPYYRDVFDFSIHDGTRWREAMMRFNRDGSTAFMEGNVGVGVTNPQRKLVVQNDTRINPSTVLGLYNIDPTDGTDTVLSFRGDTSGVGATSFKELTAIQSKIVTHDNTTAAANLGFYTTSGGALRESMRIDSNGNVGIDTAIPSFRLHVTGDAGVTGNLFALGDVTTGGITDALGGLIIERRTSDPASPQDARLWLRTDVPPPPVQGSNNFFLLSFNQYEGNLLGYAQTNLGYTGTDALQAADRICLNEVNTNDFIGKPAGKTYTQAEVYSFLCTSIACRNLLSSSTYVMGRLGSTHGGNTFTTNASQEGPNDNFDWSTLNGFDATAEYWTNRNWIAEDRWRTALPFTRTSCTNWTSSVSSISGLIGSSTNVNHYRWHCPSCSLSCAVPRNLLCVVEGS